MFSYKFCCEPEVAPGVNLIIPIAIVKAIKTVGFQMSANLSLITKLGLKWPNDVYFEDQKIGGALVNIRPKGDLIYMNIGIGINVDNPKPTTCLNAHFNGKFTREHILIEYLKSFDELFNRLTSDPASVLVEYKENWIH
jgi:biotin--protein ligase